MQAIATLLNKDADNSTRKMWDQLEQCCGLSGIRLTPTPHFSWFVADSFSSYSLFDEIKEITRKFTPIKVSTTGLGIFVLDKPVLYLPIVKTRQLLEMHEVIWNALTKYGTNISENYQPDMWIPHITLAHNDLSKNTITCAIDNLMDLRISLMIDVDNLALIFATEESAGIIHQEKFLAEEK